MIQSNKQQVTALCQQVFLNKKMVEKYLFLEENELKIAGNLAAIIHLFLLTFIKT
ncbi:hypothetical protein [Mucilaginibacter sp. SP1R1]|uniref:hypothetical protein n=1 Tax=Mucilaginibacter sp. SP1R1 TaxID=2723091 RepID=UPI00161C397C|nr:hypothetical protein [Mucilaginibacter sp. SP1R1]MBB6147946.1 hypothetical protein [Mucilaginibacter sp. SP1R1]